MSDDKPFLCPVKDCGMRFTNEDHLNVHSKKHEMSLALNTNKNSGSPGPNFLDQTPTPTNFLKNCEEINLFQEWSKNPFDDAYKKALDPDASPLPGPQTNELNTPTLILNDNPKYNSSTTGAVSTSLLRSTEPVVPSPLVKKNNAALDLSGKAVIIAQQTLASRQAKSKEQCDHTSQVADSTSTEFPVLSSPSEVKDETEVSSRLLGFKHYSREDEDRVHTKHMKDMLSKQQQQSREASLQLSIPAFNNSVTTIPQPLSSPHSTTSSNFTVLQTSPLSKKDGVGNLEASNVKKEPDDLTNGSSASQQQCTMQVWLQLPSGQTVPISIPATINSLQVVNSEEESQQNPRPVKPQVTQVVKGIPHQPSNTHIQPQTQVPVLQPAPAKPRTITTSQAGQNTTIALKQRLKAQLQSQLSPTAKSLADSNLVSPSNSAFIPAGAAVPAVTTATQVFITDPSNSSPIMMIDSPGSEVNLSDSSDYSFDNKRQKMSPDCEDPKERRRKFLERNRAAAARCRQKRKHWISNLEKKADELQNTNVRLQSDVKLLRGEVAHLKTLLLAHKDCPVTQQQRSSGQLQHLILGEPSSFSNQELAQVVPTAEVTTESIQLTHPTIVTFVQETIGGQQIPDVTKQD